MHNTKQLPTNLIQNANPATGVGAAIVHSGNIMVCEIIDISTPDDPCQGREPRGRQFGFVEIDEDLFPENKLQTGEYVVVYRPSNLTEWVFRVREVVAQSPSGTRIHLIGGEHSDLTEIEVGDMIVIGVNLHLVKDDTCEAPEALKATRIRSTSARLEFSREFEVEVYRVRYKPTQSNEWLEMDVTGGVYYANVTDLIPTTEYEWEVMGFCSFPDVYSMYSTKKTFTTR